MKQMFLIKYGEIILKGLNRRFFEDKLIRNIKNSLSALGKFEVVKEQAAIYVKPLEKIDTDQVGEKIKKIFGIVNYSVVYEVEKDLDVISEKSVEYLKDKLISGVTFKVETKRSDKRYPHKSPEVSRIVGGYILNHIPELKVDVHNPQVTVNVEIRNSAAYLYTDKVRCAGGLPVGTSGRSCLLLSGGIDSPVAGWMISKRGVELEGVHFFSHPYTSERAKEKVLDLSKELAQYCGTFKLHIVPFTDIQLEIYDKCPEELLTLIMRRFMMKIAEKIAVNNKCESLITGESLGQVASQTMLSLHVTNSAVSLPVFRPLVGMDKDEIINIAKNINTYETSVLPYEDCCTIFVPKHPTTRPKLEKLEDAEKVLNTQEMIQKAVEETATVVIKNS